MPDCTRPAASAADIRRAGALAILLLMRSLSTSACCKALVGARLARMIDPVAVAAEQDTDADGERDHRPQLPQLLEHRRRNDVEVGEQTDHAHGDQHGRAEPAASPAISPAHESLSTGACA